MSICNWLGEIFYSIPRKYDTEQDQIENRDYQY